jgi:hypothetical protein
MCFNRPTYAGNDTTAVLTEMRRHDMQAIQYSMSITDLSAPHSLPAQGLVNDGLHEPPFALCVSYSKRSPLSANRQSSAPRWAQTEACRRQTCARLAAERESARHVADSAGMIWEWVKIRGDPRNTADPSWRDRRRPGWLARRHLWRE